MGLESSNSKGLNFIFCKSYCRTKPGLGLSMIKLYIEKRKLRKLLELWKFQVGFVIKQILKFTPGLLFQENDTSQLTEHYFISRTNVTELHLLSYWWAINWIITRLKTLRNIQSQIIWILWEILFHCLREISSPYPFYWAPVSSRRSRSFKVSLIAKHWKSFIKTRIFRSVHNKTPLSTEKRWPSRSTC